GHKAKLATFDLFDNGKFLRCAIFNFRHENAPLTAAGFLLFHLSTIWGAYQSALLNALGQPYLLLVFPYGY
ncbi:hypothetical protein AB4Z50_34660, partial [Paenibacillus sp. 2TAB26]|uniref:hypothetical protein n=1 Tax=Paenibacillus sp. 2TAB26 TaxID=3233005 RepID=UPI003F9670D6